MANIDTRIKALASRIETASGPFRRNILNNTVQLIPLNKESIKAHAAVQIKALSDLLDQRKVTPSVIDNFGELLFRELLSNLLAFKHSDVEITKLSNSTSDKKLLASAGQQFTRSTVVFRARSLRVRNIRLDKFLKDQVVLPTNLVAVNFLASIKRKDAIINPIKDMLDLSPMFTSSSTFKSTVRELIKSAQRLPKENRAKYLSNVKKYANSAIKKVSSSYRNSDWDIQAAGKHNISLQKISSAATITLALTAPTNTKPAQLIKIEQEALKALISAGKESFGKLLLQDSGVLPKVERMLRDVIVSSITKKKINRNNKGNFISKAEVLKGITSGKSVVSRSAVWRREGAERLTDVTKNLLGIRNILNEFLPAHMEKNMGRGNSNTVLNYRTGRLADSAKVNLIHPIRNNVISAKINYLRNPYDVYSPGGDRDRPPTRDPKRLLDKSIRQILKEKLQLSMAFKSELS